MITGMSGKMYKILLPLLMIILFSCEKENRGQKKKETYSESGDQIDIHYASRFQLIIFDSFKELKVISPWPGSLDTFTYILQKQNFQESQISVGQNSIKIQLPVKSMVCFSTTHLPYLEMLDEHEKLSGFPTTSYISSALFRKRVQAGKIKELGPSNEINFEQLLALDPDVVIAFSMNSDLSMIKKIQLSGIPVILNADYLEKHPLGRAEWIKFMAAFFDKESQADSIFSIIQSQYISTKRKLESVSIRPSVYTGVVYGDTWFMPGGRHYGSIFFQDAGADYLWSANQSDETLQLSFESVYEKAQDADFWIGVATYHSLKEIQQADERYTHFKAFDDGHVYNYIAKLSDNGGNAYFEEGYARPDIILNDLAKIFHPELMSDHQFYFYEKLY